MPQQQNKPPVHTIRLRYLKATIWANAGENGTFHTVDIVRAYKKGDDWKDTPSMGRDNLLELAKIADQAHTWICEHEAAARALAREEKEKVA